MVRQNVHFCGLTSLLSHSKQSHSYLYLRGTKYFKTYNENPGICQSLLVKCMNCMIYIPHLRICQLVSKDSIGPKIVGCFYSNLIMGLNIGFFVYIVILRIQSNLTDFTMCQKVKFFQMIHVFSCHSIIYANFHVIKILHK